MRVLELPRKVGKAAALTQGCALARYEILVFADMRQTWAADALRLLLENFADPEVGAVSGDLVIEAAPGVLAGVGLYWRFEKWLRRRESRVCSMVGVTGGDQRRAPRAVPAHSAGDDPGRRLLAVAGRLCRATASSTTCMRRAYDRLPARTSDEFRRKVRTLAGNFQLATLLPGALLPWRNPIWLQFLSHKLLRLAVPWALLVLLAAEPRCSRLGLPDVAFWRRRFATSSACSASYRRRERVSGRRRPPRRSWS